MRNPTDKVYPLIEGFEDRRMVVYLDGGGVPTAGVGHTGRDVPIVGDKVTAAQVDAWFHADVLDAVKTIERYVPADVVSAIPDVSYDALVSFVFNVGAQAFVDPVTGKQTNFSKTLNARKWDEVDDRMRDWVYDNGKKVNGLVNRRATESAQWSLGFDAAIKADAKVEMAAAAAAASPATAMPAEVTGIVPSPPPKAKVFNGKSITGLATAAAGALASNAGDLVNSGNQLRTMLADMKWASAIGGTLVAVGTIILLWEKLHARGKSGA